MTADPDPDPNVADNALPRLLAFADSLRRAGRLSPAIDAYQQLTITYPEVAAIHNNLGIAYRDAGFIQQSIATLRKAAELAPMTPVVWNNLANSLRISGNLDEAVAVYFHSRSLAPHHVATLNNLATTLHESGRLFDAIDLLREAIAIDPTRASVHSNLLYHLHFDARASAAEIRREHEIWNERHARPLHRVAPFTNERSADRVLRVGYVSSHLEDHVIGRFLVTLFLHHDSTHFQVTCHAPNDGLPELDIAVDLDMHLSGGHPLLFARRVAPVQVTYLGYVAGAGVEGIDYRFSDPYLDPIGWEENYIEKTVHLPETYWCYQPPMDVNIAPVPHDGIVFGCLNNFAKTMPAALPIWGDLLRRVPNARLVLSSPAPSADRLAIDALKVDSARLTFVRFQSVENYLKLYNTIDVALDPFPYGGGTTTFDALYMGVPVVTLAGKTSVGRGGVSILSNLGLQQLIAQTHEQYINIAASKPKLPGLRERMQASPLMDGLRFTRGVESAYRSMWRHWCASAISDSSD